MGLLASKKAKKLGKISYVVRDRRSSNFGSKKRQKNWGKTSFVVRIERPPILAPKKGKKFGQSKG